MGGHGWTEVGFRVMNAGIQDRSRRAGGEMGKWNIMIIK